MSDPWERIYFTNSACYGGSGDHDRRLIGAILLVVDLAGGCRMGRASRERGMPPGVPDYF